MALFGWLSSRSNSCKCTRQSCRKRGAAGNWGCYVSPILWAPGVPKGCTAAALGCLDRVPASHGQSTLGLFLSICSPRGSRGAKIIIREGRHCREQAGVIYFLQPPQRLPGQLQQHSFALLTPQLHPAPLGAVPPPGTPKAGAEPRLSALGGTTGMGWAASREMCSSSLLNLPL